jgi:NinB protein
MTQVTLHNAQQGHHAMQLIWAEATAMLVAGHKMTLELREFEDVLSDRLRKYYHGHVLTEIARQASPGGQKHAMPVWKEYFRIKYWGSKRKTFIDPVTGKKSRRMMRVSSESLSVKKYAELIECVTAYASTELGVRFMAFADYIDPETGEVLS